MSARPRIAVIGAGSMGSLHARVISQSERADLAGIIDRDAVAGRALAERHGVDWQPEAGDLTGIDAVVVAAPTEAHPALGLDILRRGLPLLMEKPMADRLADAEELVALADKDDIPLMCGLLERYNPGVLTAIKLVEDPRQVSTVRHSPAVKRIRTGVASDLLIHDLDLAVRIAGDAPSTVRGFFGYLKPRGRGRVEDSAEALIGFASGMTANLSASRMSQRKIRQLSIAEPKRLVEVDLLRNAVTIYRHVLNEATPDGLAYRQQTIIDIPALASSREPLAAQLDRFVDLVTGTVDADAAATERAQILPAHQVLDAVRADAQR